MNSKQDVCIGWLDKAEFRHAIEQSSCDDVVERVIALDTKRITDAALNPDNTVQVASFDDIGCLARPGRYRSRPRCGIYPPHARGKLVDRFIGQEQRVQFLSVCLSQRVIEMNEICESRIDRVDTVISFAERPQ